MKALVLSGGRGTRLRPLTHTFAKQLIPIANKPILFYGLEAIKKTGIKDVGIVISALDEQAPAVPSSAGLEIQQAVGDGSRFGLRVKYIIQDAPAGLAHAVKISRDFLGDEPFLMFLGDNLLKEGLEGLVLEFRDHPCDAQILVAKVPRPQEFGVVEVDDRDHVLRLEEKPAQPKSDLALVGVYMFTPAVFDVIEKLKPSKRGELEITDAIQGLLDQRRVVRCRRVDGWWKDTGRLEDLLEANRLILDTLEPARKNAARVDAKSRLEGRVIVEEGCEIVDSTIRGPVIVGRGSRIERSYLGPYTAIDHDVTVTDSEIEHSIVLEHARISSVRPLRDSLVGQRAEVVKAPTRPAGYRVMLGDSSRVEVP